MAGKDYQQHWNLIREVLRIKNENNFIIYSDHAEKRLMERNVTKTEIKTLLDRCDPCEMYDRFKYPHGEKPFSNKDPVFTIRGELNGRMIAVGLAVAAVRNGIEFSVVTVITPKNGRHINT